MSTARIMRRWRQIAYIEGQGGDCIEVATCPHTIHIRDSKDLTVPALAVSPTSWTSFVDFAAS